MVKVAADGPRNSNGQNYSTQLLFCIVYYVSAGNTNWGCNDFYPISHCTVPTLVYTSNRDVVCLKTGPYPLPKRVPQIVRSSASAFNFRYFVVTSKIIQKLLTSSSSSRSLHISSNNVLWKAVPTKSS
jgi:hypothetical protein